MTPASDKRRLMDVVKPMDKLYALLLANPRAVIESGVMIPCALRGALEIEDDESIRTTPLPVVVRTQTAAS